jgi:hypothetical protein
VTQRTVRNTQTQGDADRMAKAEARIKCGSERVRSLLNMNRMPYSHSHPGASITMRVIP